MNVACETLLTVDINYTFSPFLSLSSPDGNVLFLVPVQTQLLHGRRFMGPFASKSHTLSPHPHCVGVFDAISQRCSLCVVCVGGGGGYTFYPAVHARTHTLKHTHNHHTLQTIRGVWQIRVVCITGRRFACVCVCVCGVCVCVCVCVCVLICNLLLSHFNLSPINLAELISRCAQPFLAHTITHSLSSPWHKAQSNMK